MRERARRRRLGRLSVFLPTRAEAGRACLTRKLLALTLVGALGACSCGRAPEPRASDADIPLESAVDAPWVENAVGIIEESSPGSGIYLLQPGDYRARLPEGFHRSGLRVVFSGRPQPVPPGRTMIGTPFVLFAIRRERSAVEVLLEQMREGLGIGDPAEGIGGR